MSDLMRALLLSVSIAALGLLVSMLIMKRIYKRLHREQAANKMLKQLTFTEAFAGIVNKVTAYTSSEYERTAGGRIANFFDTDKVLMAAPEFLELLSSEIVSRLEEMLRRHPSGKVCFIEKDSGPIGMVVIASLVANKLGRPVSTVRPRRDVWKLRIEGAPIQRNDEVILIQDVFTSGLQVVRATRALTLVGARTVGVVALVDREEVAQAMDPEFVGMNVDFVSVQKLSELCACLPPSDSKKTDE